MECVGSFILEMLDLDINRKFKDLWIFGKREIYIRPVCNHG